LRARDDSDHAIVAVKALASIGLIAFPASRLDYLRLFSYLARLEWYLDYRRDRDVARLLAYG
jgi:hypothetical protein